jgi:neutral ceramidase
MRIAAFLAFAALFTTAPLRGAGPVPPTSSIKAGFAERDITPELGMEQPGGYGKAFHRAFHDPCKVRAAVFDDGKKRIALVGLDALITPRKLSLDARAEIQKLCGIRADCVIIGASHSHSSGPVGMVQPHELDFAPPLVRQLAYEESSCADAGYLMKVQKAIVDAVVWADKNKTPALLGFGSGTEDKVSFNRRLRMENGQTWSHPGPGNPDIIGYAGPIDPQVGVIAAWDLNGALLGTIVNFACHATAGPGGISANWIHYLEQTIQGSLQSRAPVVFLQGACGDITQVDNLDPYQRPTPEEWSQRVGGRVGAEAVKVILMMTKTGDAAIDARQKLIKIKRRVPGDEHVKQSLELVQQPKPKGDTTDWMFAKEIVMLDASVRKEPETEVEIVALQLGPVAFVSNPAEYFVNNGLRIKKESGFPLTFPVELANGCTGYVPDEEAFGPGGGGYETRLSFYSNLEPRAGTIMADTGIGLARQMTPGRIPEPPKASPFSKPWGYGAVAPQVR